MPPVPPLLWYTLPVSMPGPLSWPVLVDSTAEYTDLTGSWNNLWSPHQTGRTAQGRGLLGGTTNLKRVDICNISELLLCLNLLPWYASFVYLVSTTSMSRLYMSIPSTWTSLSPDTQLTLSRFREYPGGQHCGLPDVKEMPIHIKLRGKILIGGLSIIMCGNTSEKI